MYMAPCAWRRTLQTAAAPFSVALAELHWMQKPQRPPLCLLQLRAKQLLSQRADSPLAPPHSRCVAPTKATWIAFLEKHKRSQGSSQDAHHTPLLERQLTGIIVLLLEQRPHLLAEAEALRWPSLQLPLPMALPSQVHRSLLRTVQCQSPRRALRLQGFAPSAIQGHEAPFCQPRHDHLFSPPLRCQHRAASFCSLQPVRAAKTHFRQACHAARCLARALGDAAGTETPDATAATPHSPHLLLLMDARCLEHQFAWRVLRRVPRAQSPLHSARPLRGMMPVHLTVPLQQRMHHQELGRRADKARRAHPAEWQHECDRWRQRSMSFCACVCFLQSLACVSKPLLLLQQRPLHCPTPSCLLSDSMTRKEPLYW
mmetsp:Transcript_38226/g.89712  ORF Transcript_38226/g.89712 Transcript_38226/m.89712 type:complete len:371 (+) Transcript_38226:850-1962(+)